tara:strand:+ start:118 stop:459 length:342 start_codon:yes stop_codon:yes gene_type:complete
MRKRCFIIAAIALVIGVAFHHASYPEEIIIKIRKKQNDRLEETNERIRAYGKYSYRATYQDPYERDSNQQAIGNFAIVLGGVLLIVGFIAGTKKEESIVKEHDPIDLEDNNFL